MNVRSIILLLALDALHQTNGETIVAFDLSYQPHLKPIAVAETIQATLAKQINVNCIELDVSYSEMSNSGVCAILEGVTNVGLALSARMNRLTPEGVHDLLERANKNDLHMKSLDLGWNNLHPEEPGYKEFLSSLRQLIESPQCPNILRLDCCGLGPGACRALGKGIMKRCESGVYAPLSLHLSGNKDVGDAGIAALAAAIRGSTSSSESASLVFEELNLSGCNIDDVGAEALAMALEAHPGCIKHLDLSNNKISNEGATAIGRALSMRGKDGLSSLDLSNNPNLGNTGASALANAVGCGMIETLLLRSCNIQADGAKAFGEVLKTLATKKEMKSIKLDLSGNPLGILRKVKKGQKYSASALKSKASATTASYMNFIGRKIKSGLKEVGLDGVADSFVNTSESDDEEDERMGANESNDDIDPAKARCGAKAFAGTTVVSEHDASPTTTSLRCELGLRQCHFDEGAADALAATILQAKERFGIELTIDARMSPALEEELIDALACGDTDRLEFMAERHMQALEVIRVSEQRAAEAGAAARRRESLEDDDEFAPYDFEEDDEHDSYEGYDDA